jgi:hypothetical protein
MGPARNEGDREVSRAGSECGMSARMRGKIRASERAGRVSFKRLARGGDLRAHLGTMSRGLRACRSRGRVRPAVQGMSE